MHLMLILLLLLYFKDLLTTVADLLLNSEVSLSLEYPTALFAYVSEIVCLQKWKPY